MELGESLEQTACREVFEEVGLTCNNLKLFNVYSGRTLYYKYPDRNEVYNVTATYLCKNFSGQINVDFREGTDAQFYSFDQIPLNLSSTIKEIISDFLSQYGDLKQKSII